MADAQTHTIGRRKEAVCRVYLKAGSGKWTVNGRTLGDYFPRPAHVSSIQQPFTATDTLGRYDVTANIDGGGRVHGGTSKTRGCGLQRKLRNLSRS